MTSSINLEKTNTKSKLVSLQELFTTIESRFPSNSVTITIDDIINDEYQIILKRNNR